MRGDWQIASWLLPWVPGQDIRWVRNPISARSPGGRYSTTCGGVSYPSRCCCCCWVRGRLGSSLGITATLFVVTVVSAVPLLAVFHELLRKPVELPLWTHLRVTVHGAGNQLIQVLFTLTFLPYDALISFDAIVRTLVRVYWTRKNLLEWKTSSDANRSARSGLPGFFQSMWVGPTVAAAAGLALALGQSTLLPLVAPLLGLWLVSPLVAWWLSRPLAATPVRLLNSQRVFLGKLSRRTWRFFETFVTAEENWLPPDNFRENAGHAVASRTSPTNIGMALLADLAAHDFGYCSAGRLLDRTQKTLATLARMERYRGHFYNWYDTRSLKPLPPRYVSTVDSGNLAGDLLVLRGGLLELVQAPVLSPRIFDGLGDTARVLLDVARGNHRSAGEDRVALVSPDVLRKFERLEDLERPPSTLSAATAFLQRLAVTAAENTAAAGLDEELLWWARAFERSCIEHRDELLQLAGWAALPVPPARAWSEGSPVQLDKLKEVRERLTLLDAAPTLREVAALQIGVIPTIDAILSDLLGDDRADVIEWFGQMRRALVDASQRAIDRIKALESISQHCQELADMDFSFLLDKSRDLFAIGYNVGDQRLDASFYDLLASEARLASFVAIAQGQVGQANWFALGRMLTQTGGAAALLSWSGSMFEYLMPLLIMPTYEGTLLDQTYKGVVRRQIRYGKQRGVPWGISESGYNTTDVHLNYQYRAFGVPGLGLDAGSPKTSSSRRMPAFWP